MRNIEKRKIYTLTHTLTQTAEIKNLTVVSIRGAYATQLTVNGKGKKRHVSFHIWTVDLVHSDQCANSKHIHTHKMVTAVFANMELWEDGEMVTYTLSQQSILIGDWAQSFGAANRLYRKQCLLYAVAFTWFCTSDCATHPWWSSIATSSIWALLSFVPIDLLCVCARVFLQFNTSINNSLFVFNCIHCQCLSNLIDFLLFLWTYRHNFEQNN